MIPTWRLKEYDGSYVICARRFKTYRRSDDELHTIWLATPEEGDKILSKDAEFCLKNILVCFECGTRSDHFQLMAWSDTKEIAAYCTHCADQYGKHPHLKKIKFGAAPRTIRSRLVEARYADNQLTKWAHDDGPITSFSVWDNIKQQPLTNSKIKRGGNMSLILFKDGDQMGIQTDCTTEDEFTSSFASALENLIAEKKFEDDWAFQFQWWLKQFAEIVCVYRGYRATEVRKSTVLSVGNTNPQDAVFKELAGEQNRPVLEGFIKHVNGEAKST